MGQTDPDATPEEEERGPVPGPARSCPPTWVIPRSNQGTGHPAPVVGVDGIPLPQGADCVFKPVKVCWSISPLLSGDASWADRWSRRFRGGSGAGSSGPAASGVGTACTAAAGHGGRSPIRHSTPAGARRTSLQAAGPGRPSQWGDRPGQPRGWHRTDAAPPRRPASRLRGGAVAAPPPRVPARLPVPAR